MIELDNVSFTYNSSERESGVHNISITIPTGQVVLFCGESGCGKTTLTRIINKLIPEYYEGKMSGKVIIDDKDVTGQTIYDFNGKIGTVFQNPRSQFFNVDTTSEIAFGCENYGIEQQEILRRIGQAIGEMKIQNLMGRNLFALSGGEKQKVACASVSAMEPDIFILDEPSSNLDVATIWDLRQAIIGWKKKGKTILIAEHRLYYLMGVADRVVYLKEGRIAKDVSAVDFGNLSEAQLQKMGLRSLHPTFTSEIPVTPMNDETISLTDFRFTDSNLNHTGIYLYSKGKIMIHLTFDYKTDEKCTTPGQYLKYHRTFQGFTTRELAEKVGIVPATLVLYENDRHPIKHSTAVALANALGIDRNRLLDKYTAFVDYPYSSLLKKVRQELSLTQMQMAEVIGIGQTSYSGWEREIRVPRRKEYEKILAALKKLKVNVDTYLCHPAST